MSRFSIVALPLVAALAGCASVGPDYVKPEIDVPAGWREAPADGARAQGPEWWKLYGDPVLDRLVAEALKNNANLMLAAARVEEARKLVDAADAWKVTEGAGQPQQTAARATASASRCSSSRATGSS